MVAAHVPLCAEILAPRMFRRVLGFAAIPAISLLSPLIALPFLTRAAGPEGWAGVAIGQAFGAVAALFIQFGWGVVGPPLVAGLDRSSARNTYYTSVVMRLMLSVLVIPLAVTAATVVVPPQWQLTASLLCIATAFSGLSSSWYFVGIGRPLPLLWFETVPRVLGMLLSTLLLVTTGSVELFAWSTLITEGTMTVVQVVCIARCRQAFSAVLADVWMQVRYQWVLAASGLVASGYTRLSVPIVASIAYAHAPVFASADRIQTLARSVIRPFVQSFQGWVAESVDDAGEHRRRFLLGSAVVAGVSVTVAAGVTLLLPTFAAVLFGPMVKISILQAALLAAAIISIGLSSCASNFYLAPRRKIRPIAVSTTVCSIVGVGFIWLCTSSFGVEGALAAIALTELTVFGWQIAVVTKDIRQSRYPPRLPRRIGTLSSSPR